MDKKNRIETAQKRVKAKKQFYSHFNAFCIVTIVLFLINFVVTPGVWWFLFAIVGWAFAVLGHYLNVFGFPSFRDEIWEEEQFELEMDKLERRQKLEAHQKDALDISDEKLELKELKKNPQEYDTDDLV